LNGLAGVGDSEAAWVFCTLVVAVFLACGSPESVDGTDSLNPRAASPEPSRQERAVPAGWPQRFGYGREAARQEIAAWDIDVRPDGRGLPTASGSVREGARLYRARCAVCHGETGVEGPDYPLVGRIADDAFPFGSDPGAIETIGSYWPYATTLFDYIRRTMPYSAPGSLTPEEVYAVVAYLLFLNELVTEEAVLDHRTLPAVRMPARDRFVPDDRRGGAEVR